MTLWNDRWFKQQNGRLSWHSKFMAVLLALTGWLFGTPIKSFLRAQFLVQVTAGLDLLWYLIGMLSSVANPFKETNRNYNEVFECSNLCEWLSNTIVALIMTGTARTLVLLDFITQVLVGSFTHIQAKIGQEIWFSTTSRMERGRKLDLAPSTIAIQSIPLE